MTSGMGDRTKILIGDEGFGKLRDARVVLCGAGAVGGYVLEGLVRAGVGHIRVVDADTFSDSNLNRQILATAETVGRKKAEVAAERARSINPEIDIETMCQIVSADTVPEILSGKPDIVADAIDTIEHKAALIRGSVGMGIPVFSSMGAAMHFDTQSIKVATLKKTKVCPLAAAIRSKLRDIDTSSVTCVYSEEQLDIKPSERDEHGKSVLGSLPTVPAVFGMVLANQIIMHIISDEPEE